MVKKYFSGFTLVELMIVLAIIAILAALVISFFTGQIFKGNDAKRKGDINRIKIAVEEYEKDHNCYPTDVTCTHPYTLQPYLDRIPCDPITGTSYYYEYEGSTCPRWFRLYALLQNTQDSSIILGIGLHNAYNYVQSSENAPNVASGAVASPSPSGTGYAGGSIYYGCINGVCTQISLDANGVPVCSPNYTESSCGVDKCDSPVNNCTSVP